MLLSIITLTNDSLPVDFPKPCKCLKYPLFALSENQTLPVVSFVTVEQNARIQQTFMTYKLSLFYYSSPVTIHSNQLNLEPR